MKGHKAHCDNINCIPPDSCDLMMATVRYEKMRRKKRRRRKEALNGNEYINVS